MKICANCGKLIPTRIEANGELKYLKHRKYCLECSPFNSHNTKKLERTDFGVECVCDLCNKKYIYTKERKGNSRHRCQSCYTKLRRIATKAKSVEYKGGQCSLCGYNKCINALCFHHLNPTEKDFEIANFYHKSWKIIQAELDKCILLCQNCHYEVHADLAAHS